MRPRCCIRRNPTKGIESGFYQKPSGKSPCHYVAFEEIPQRELRVIDVMAASEGVRAGCIRRNPTKGIERVFSSRPTYGLVDYLVAFEEIPQRELRENYVFNSLRI